MQIRNYNNELITANILFQDLFNGFIITRSLDSENKTATTINVPLVQADRSRIFKSLENLLAAKALVLPIITWQRTGVQVAT